MKNETKFFKLLMKLKNKIEDSVAVKVESVH